jgi:hypothetical protein
MTLLGWLLATLFARRWLLTKSSARLPKLFRRASSRAGLCSPLIDCSFNKSMYGDSVLHNLQQAGHYPGEQHAPGWHPLPAHGGPLLQWDGSACSGGQDQESDSSSSVIALSSFIRSLVIFFLLLNISKHNNSHGPWIQVDDRCKLVIIFDLCIVVKMQ